ncbi:EpsG family protein [uncultured Pontibacter sp.]|uniref:EpsG family protein n=1 Tax=uncultured Pontibacter sp. TaxID=453356 RepID=UPI00261D15AC|nr:EpsG family protein [uncultured Pontibacter sp.]
MNRALSIILFIISPLAGVTFSFISFFLKKTNELDYYFFCVLMSLLIGIINSGKVLDSDFLNYYDSFINVENMTFIEYIYSMNKEPFFFLYNYIAYYLFFGNFDIYIVATTTIGYTFMCHALIRCHSLLKSSNVYLFIAIFILFLFPNIFSLSAHLIRQFLAMSILLILTVEFVFYAKNKYSYFISSMLIHTSSVIFGLIYIIKITNGARFKLYIAIVITFLIITIFIKFPLILGNLSFNNVFLDYGITRLQNIDKQFVDLESLNISSYIMFIFIVVIFYIFWKEYSINIKNSYILFFISIVLLFFIAINHGNTEISLRFSFYFYSLLPLSIYLFLSLVDIKIVRLYPLMSFSIIFLFLLPWFLYKLLNGAWVYNNISRIYFIGFW